MDWKKCVSEKTIRKIEPDKERVRNMLKLVDIRLEFWDSVSKIINEKFASLITEAYYEVIKELLTAYLNLEGLESSNHECLICQKYTASFQTGGQSPLSTFESAIFLSMLKNQSKVE